MQKEEDLKKAQESLTETQKEKATLEMKVHGFTRELQDQRMNAEEAETSLIKLKERNALLVSNNKFLKQEHERLAAENEKLKEDKVALKKQLCGAEGKLRHIEVDFKVAQIQMDWSGEDVSQY